MIDDAFFEAQFPKAVPLLREICAKDAEFDRICSDYYDLFSELAQPRLSTGALPSQYIADLAESLSDLRNTIENRLRAQTAAIDEKARHSGET